MSAVQFHGAYSFLHSFLPPLSLPFSLIGSAQYRHKPRKSKPTLRSWSRKVTRLEVYKVGDQGLQAPLEVPVYGRVSSMFLYRPEGRAKDLLFFLTEHYKVAVVEYDDSTGEIVTKAAGDVQDRIGRPCDGPQKGCVDPASSVIGLFLYDGLLKVVPVEGDGLHEAYNVRLNELEVIDMHFLHVGSGSKPTLAVLSEDTKSNRLVRTYELLLHDKQTKEGPFRHLHADPGASMLIPVPQPLGGVIVVGESSVAYVNQGTLKSTGMALKHICSWERIDSDGSRYLLSDHTGALHLLALSHSEGLVQGVQLTKIGDVTPASTMSYVDNGVVFLGSRYGDSQLVRLEPGQPAGQMVKSLERFTSLGPIQDLIMVDLERQGQGQAITCTGVFSHGSLRVVRNGIGLNALATLHELEGAKGIFSLKERTSDRRHSHLVISFVGETKFLGMDEDEALAEIEPPFPGFDASSPSVVCATASHDQVLQVTPSAVILSSSQPGAAPARWEPPAFEARIGAAASNLSQAVLVSGGSTLVCLGIEGWGTLDQRGRKELKVEASCVDCTPMGDDTGEGARLGAVGFWDNSIALLSLPDLTELVSVSADAEAVPRSVLLRDMGGSPYLLAGLGDGNLHAYALEMGGGAPKFGERKRVSLGTQPLRIVPTTTRGVRSAFVASDRPTVVHSSSDKLLFSNVNLPEASYVCPFDHEHFPDALAVVSRDALILGAMDEIQKLHIRSVPLGEQPRRIAHCDDHRALAVLTVRPQQGTVPDDVDAEEGFLRVFDEQTFECTSSFSLKQWEQPCSLLTCRLPGKGPRLIAGTAFVWSNESEPSRGRLLVFQIDGEGARGGLTLEQEIEVSGAAYSLAYSSAAGGSVLAGVNSKVEMLTVEGRGGGGSELTRACSHVGHITVLLLRARGDFVVVGDLMKSISLLMYKPEQGELEERARDYNATWMTAVEVLDEDSYLGADNSHNLFVVRKNADAATDEERQRLDVTGEFHAGDLINAIRPGSLTMSLPDSELGNVPTFVFGTVGGAIGVIAVISREQFEFLSSVEHALRDVVKGVGGLSHSQWRAFHNERRSAPDSRRFVDGDFVETFLDLPRDRMELVADRVGIPVDTLVSRLEDFSRIH